MKPEVFSFYRNFQCCRRILLFTPHGRYRRKDLPFQMNEWFCFTVVYDSEPNNNDGTGNKVYIDDTMYPMERHKLENSPLGTGKMALGRILTDEERSYSDVLVDDLTMWNKKLTKEEIKEIKEIEN